MGISALKSGGQRGGQGGGSWKKEMKRKEGWEEAAIKQ